ncbi:protein of unknown function [Methylocaldum szegediense]|uniref:Transposase n=1 Tax=Methylocaldum szegediense TaxID=73780 RepID=A0ABM9I9J6_9GAMM|nr:protein of unknown function [Methylocaldum szegediense]
MVGTSNRENGNRNLVVPIRYGVRKLGIQHEILWGVYLKLSGKQADQSLVVPLSTSHSVTRILARAKMNIHRGPELVPDSKTLDRLLWRIVGSRLVAR